MPASDYFDSQDLKAVLAGGLINEDVMQKIWDISHIPLPFTERVQDDVADQAFTEWTTDELADPDLTNAVASGHVSAGNDAGSNGARVGNHCQNSIKEVKVTDRANNSDTIGRAREFPYQLMMRQQELRRDVEAISLSPQASVEDQNDDVTVGKAGGLDAWLETNVDVGVTGAVGGFNTATKLVEAPTNGTIRALSEANLSERVEEAYNENGNVSVLMSVPALIKRLGRFLLGGGAPVATPTANVKGSGGKEEQTAQGYVNVLVTDFGTTLELIPNRLQQLYNADTACSLFGLDVERVGLAYLQRYVTKPLGRKGLAEEAIVSVDWTLKVYNEKAHFNIRDLDPTAPVTA